MHKINKAYPRDLPYCAPLLDIPTAPKTIYHRGLLPESRLPSVAIVGTRRPTPYGRGVAEKISGALAARGVVIVSGLAFGIDAIAHQAALDAKGTTIAVLASGLDNVSPTSHRQLAENIMENGALLSDYEPGTEPLPFRFLERNRLVSGLSDAIIVIEAAERSGTLSTVSHALEQGKEVFAVPGPITSPLSAGCNRLILNGAAPLLDIQQLYDCLGMTEGKLIKNHADTKEEETLINLLQAGVTDGDILSEKSEMDIALYQHTMTMLELKGAIAPQGGNHWRLV